VEVAAQAAALLLAGRDDALARVAQVGRPGTARAAAGGGARRLPQPASSASSRAAPAAAARRPRPGGWSYPRAPAVPCSAASSDVSPVARPRTAAAGDGDLVHRGRQDAIRSGVAEPLGQPASMGSWRAVHQPVDRGLHPVAQRQRQQRDDDSGDQRDRRGRRVRDDGAEQRHDAREGGDDETAEHGQTAVRLITRSTS
jgi:hypothetical protein